MTVPGDDDDGYDNGYNADATDNNDGGNDDDDDD